ncbi:Arc family DNA-binding protein [Paracoccus sp. 22332]|uniref:Arc family DNA-binding protein n=1 Tax=Paracoccus sp. 22332 TaxID=3453913 RepID=UPI003F8743BE
MATVGRGAEQYTVRFPDGLRDRIKLAAEANGRSMNAEIVATLEKAFPAPEASFREEFFRLMDQDAAIWAVIEPLVRRQETLPPGDERAAIAEELKGLFAQSQELKAQIRELLLKADADETNPRSSAYRAKKK